MYALEGYGDFYIDGHSESFNGYYRQKVDNHVTIHFDTSFGVFKVPNPYGGFQVNTVGRMRHGSMLRGTVGTTNVVVTSWKVHRHAGSVVVEGIVCS